MDLLRALGTLVVAAVAVVLFVTLGAILLLVAAVAVLGLGVVGAVRLWLLRRRLARHGIELFPRGRSRRTFRAAPRDPDVIDVVPERE